MIISVGLPAFFSGNITPMENILNSQVPWNFKTEKKDLKIHYRWLKNQQNIKTRQTKCCTDIIVDSKTFKNAIKNAELTKQWLQRVEYCEIIIGDKEDEWHTYMILDFPWPMSKRDIIIKNKLVEVNGELLIKLEGIENYYPQKKGIERIKGFYGYWKVSSKNKQLEYSIYSAVKSPVPTWITEPFIEQNLFESISTLKEIIETKVNS